MLTRLNNKIKGKMMKSFDTDDGRGRYHRLDQPEEGIYINR